MLEDMIREQCLSVVVPKELHGTALFQWLVTTRPDLEWSARYKAGQAKARRHNRKHADLRGGDDFLNSYEWRRVRMEVIKERGRRCECCGATPADGVTVINVDHIKPRKLFPELKLDKKNLQVLCHVCNHGKGNWDQTDWRPATPETIIADSARALTGGIYAAIQEQEAITYAREGAKRNPMLPRLVKKSTITTH